MNIAFLPNLAGPDGIMILIIVLLLFGAKKLPELAKGMGQAVREFSKAKDDVHNEITRPPSPEPQKIEGKKIIYIRSNGRFQIDGGEWISGE